MMPSGPETGDGRRPFAAVVFDFDGTLVDSNAIKRDSYFAVAEAVRPGSSPAMEAALSETRGDRRAVLADFARRIGGGGEAHIGVDWLVDLYSERADAAVAAAPERPGALALLERLRADGLPRFLSSATPLANLRDIVERRGWTGLFDGVFGRPASKPESLGVILARQGLAAERLVVVGDGPDDRDSAREAGCSYLRVDGGVVHAALEGEPVLSLYDVALRLTGRRLGADDARGPPA